MTIQENKTFDLAQLARVKPIDTTNITWDSINLYSNVVGGLINEKLAVDYIEISKYIDNTPPAKQQRFATNLSNIIFHEAQRRGIVDEIEALI